MPFFRSLRAHSLALAFFLLVLSSALIPFAHRTDGYAGAMRRVPQQGHSQHRLRLEAKQAQRRRD